uniref:Uncharacterized protein n=1 Tax=Arundo donax TaxID=35708 RepID=A0A0A9HUP2_ARUDO
MMTRGCCRTYAARRQFAEQLACVQWERAVGAAGLDGWRDMSRRMGVCGDGEGDPDRSWRLRWRSRW